MITIENLPEALLAMGFTAKGKQYRKTMDGTALEVRFDKAQIVYPESKGLILNERQTCNLLAEQKRLVAKVQALQKRITDAQGVIAAAPARKQAILQRNL